MDKKRISISTQNKLILLGLVVSTVLIVGLAVFAITNIQQKISEVYGGFGEILIFDASLPISFMSSSLTILTII